MKRTSGFFHLLLWLLPPVAAVFAYPHVAGKQDFFKWMNTFLIIYVLFFSVVIHEMAHALAGYVSGDDTAKRAGRITTNPLSHVSVAGTVIVPLVLHLAGASVVFGWAKPVPFTPTKLRRHPRDQVFLSMAGPFSNFILSYLFFNLLLITSMVFGRLHPGVLQNILPMNLNPEPLTGIPHPGFWFVIFAILYMGMIINVALGVFNLIPFPPLDGFWILKAVLPKKAAPAIGKFQALGFILILVALQFGILDLIFYPMFTFLGAYHWILIYFLR